MVTVDALVADILHYRAYLKASGGGVTVTGGEPLMQPKFVAELMRSCQAEGLHTALDTSGFSDLAAAQQVLPYADLVLLDIKSFQPELYHTVTHVDLKPTLRLARHLQAMQKPTWIRFVLVPGLTDAPDNVAALAEFVSTLTNVERVEVLPFHQMGAYKWEALGYDYSLQEMQPPPPEQVEQVKAQFQNYGLRVY